MSGEQYEPSQPSSPTSHRQNRGRTEVLSDRTATVVIYVVTGIWALNIVAGMMHWNGYQPSTEINGTFMLVVGGAFVARTRAGKDEGGDKK